MARPISVADHGPSELLALRRDAAGRGQRLNSIQRESPELSKAKPRNVQMSTLRNRIDKPPGRLLGRDVVDPHRGAGLRPGEVLQLAGRPADREDLGGQVPD